MQQLLATLDRILQQEVEAYKHLIVLQREAPGVLATLTLEPFLTNLQVREHLTRNVATLEAKRLEALARLADDLGLSASTLTLQQLMARVAEPYASRFCDYRQQLHALVTEVQQLQRTYERLLCDAKAFVDKSRAFFARLRPTPTTYHQSGKLTPYPQGRLLSGRV
jgi:hypothetical protein